jgi:hypothetical protein
MSRLQPSCPRTLPTATPTLPVARTRISSSCPPVQYRCTARAATTGEGDTPGMVIVARVRRNTQQKDQLWSDHCAKRSGAQRGARVFGLVCKWEIIGNELLAQTASRRSASATHAATRAARTAATTTELQAASFGQPGW